MEIIVHKKELYAHSLSVNFVQSLSWFIGTTCQTKYNSIYTTRLCIVSLFLLIWMRGFLNSDDMNDTAFWMPYSLYRSACCCCCCCCTFQSFKLVGSAVYVCALAKKSKRQFEIFLLCLFTRFGALLRTTYMLYNTSKLIESRRRRRRRQALCIHEKQLLN